MIRIEVIPVKQLDRRMDKKRRRDEEEKRGKKRRRQLEKLSERGKDDQAPKERK